MMNILILSLSLPFIAGIITLLIPRSMRGVKEVLAIGVTLINLTIAILLFGKDAIYNLFSWGFGIDFSLRIYNFSSFTMLFAALFGFLIVLYSCVFMYRKDKTNQFYAYLLITISFANGVLLADNLILLLFFWEGLLLAMFGMIAIGNHAIGNHAIGSKSAWQTAKKAFIIVGITDLCLMSGIALTGHLAGTLAISKISLALSPLASLAFILMIIGAISKAGSMPFHSWIPDAATDAPLPFMAYLPAALEKLLGIYLLTRICMDIFVLIPNSALSILLMVIGCLTIIFAVMMALIQEDYKRLLSYHAISQVGYMILGIGTALPIGIIGGLFHMLNNAIYKSCLFLSGGAVEKEAGTTDLRQLGGIGLKMPVTFFCFLISALSISGVPPFNGFFSKELIYNAALERGMIFYLAALAGSFFTAISFLKLGHATYLGKIKDDNAKVREAPLSMLAPMIILSVLCILFGIYNVFPVRNLIWPILGQRLEGHDYAGFSVDIKLIIMTVIVLSGAILYHIFGTKTKGSPLKTSDYIHYAPVLSNIYKAAEKRLLDPYDIGLRITKIFSIIAWHIDRGVDWVYNDFIVGITYAFANRIKVLHTGNYVMYLSWSLVGMILVIAVLIYAR